MMILFLIMNKIIRKFWTLPVIMIGKSSFKAFFQVEQNDRLLNSRQRLFQQAPQVGAENVEVTLKVGCLLQKARVQVNDLGYEHRVVVS